MSYIQENPYSYDMYYDYEWYQYLLFIFCSITIMYCILRICAEQETVENDLEE